MLTIIDEEFEAVSKAMKLEHYLGDGYYATKANGLDVVLRQSSDRSNVPAMGAARNILEDYRPEVLVVVGIAGGIADQEGGCVSPREGVAPGDVVIPNYLHYGEFRKLTSNKDLQRYVAFDQPAVSLLETCVHATRRRGSWCDRIQVQAPEGSGPLKAIVRSLVAGEKVYGNPSHHEQRQLVRFYSDAVAVDMESYGVARAVFEHRRTVSYNPRLLIIRAISDIVTAIEGDVEVEAQAEVDNNAERARWKLFAAAAAAAFASEVCQFLLDSPDPRAELRQTSGSDTEVNHD
jgi:nucleoside phosphorylase